MTVDAKASELALMMCSEFAPKSAALFLTSFIALAASSPVDDPIDIDPVTTPSEVQSGFSCSAKSLILPPCSVRFIVQPEIVMPTTTMKNAAKRENIWLFMLSVRVD